MKLKERKPDFAGWASKADLECADGRTIEANAFAHQDKMTVPLVWHHDHDNPENVLGHMILENRAEGVYGYGFFNSTPRGQHMKHSVADGDISTLSIWANKLKEIGKRVQHGMIREVSLVMAGANPGAYIDQLSIQHADGSTSTVGEAIIHTGLPLDIGDDIKHEDGTDGGKDRTIAEIFESMSEEQQNVCLHMMDLASKGDSLKQSDTDPDPVPNPDGEPGPDTNPDSDPVDPPSGSTSDSTSSTAADAAPTADANSGDAQLDHSQGGMTVTNLFDTNKKDAEGNTLQIDRRKAVKEIMHSAMTNETKLTDEIDSYMLAHGIENLEVLFPDAVATSNEPEWDKRRTEWVAGVWNGVKKSPFSRIKTLRADITMEEARAKGYVTGNFKKEEFFRLTQRSTRPKTVYKKQKLDRDDIIDITTLDVVRWMKGEMRMMLEEEIARAILIGDGRAFDDEDKIADPAGETNGEGIRSIVNEHELFATKIRVNLRDSDSSYSELIDRVLLSRTLYKGSGSPVFYTTENTLVKMLLIRDNDGKRLYRTKSDVAAEMNVSDIIPVEVMEGEQVLDADGNSEGDLLGVVVNLRDYTVGADKGGEVTFFDDFDIDYNQYKYLYETRISGALTKLRSALVLIGVAAELLLTAPVQPAFDSDNNTITIPNINGVEYFIGNTLQVPGDVVIAADTTVQARPADGYYFAERDFVDYQYQV